VQVAELMTQLMGAQHTLKEEEEAHASLAESAAELAAAAAEQQRRAAGLEAELEELRRSLRQVTACVPSHTLCCAF
jgi:chromosome segregation ATPase